MSWGCIEGVPRLTGRYLECVWKVAGSSQEGIKKVSGKNWRPRFYLNTIHSQTKYCFDFELFLTLHFYKIF